MDWKPKIIDVYITKKFMGTFFMALLLIIGISPTEIETQVIRFHGSLRLFHLCWNSYYIDVVGSRANTW